MVEVAFLAKRGKMTIPEALERMKAAGIEQPDISILDDQFLQTFKDRPREDLRIKILQRLFEILSRFENDLAG